MSLADIKERGRRALHRALAVPCLLTDEDHPDGLPDDLVDENDSPVGLTVRWHNKIARAGDLNGEYGEVIDGIDRLIFNDENVTEVSDALVLAGDAPLVLARGAEITIPAYKGARYVLDTKEPSDGPLETVWVVARSRG
jgi:hypothetical protein